MGRKRKHGWHLFICQQCGRRWWTHSKNPNYGKIPCKNCGTTRITNHGFNDPREAGGVEVNNAGETEKITT